MLHALQDMLAPAAIGRLILLINHVLSREVAATDRLRAHSARVLRLRVRGWPALLPPPPELRLCISPAGLLEWPAPPAEPDALADLEVCLNLTDPLSLIPQWLEGQRPQVQVEGDARMAADVAWIAQNLRWDVAEDLESWFGPGAAQAWTFLARATRRALAEFAGPLAAAARRVAAFRPAGPAGAG